MISKLSKSIGFQTSYGLNKKYDSRLRLERIIIDVDDFKNDSSNFIDVSIFNIKANITHLSFGIKYELLKNKSAIYIPISFTKMDNNSEIIKQIEPTYIHSFTLGRNFEINPSIKALIPLGSDAKDYLLAYNLGLGIGSNLSKWVFRPEVGLLSSPFAKGSIPHMSIGLSLYK